jgi:glutamate N-acetyltransferase/amino-acid N-acetyltransferase
VLLLGGRAAGIKPKGSTSACSRRSTRRTSAARFTSNARVGAPVIASREARLDGCARSSRTPDCSNVGDGDRGLETAREMQRAVAEELELEPDQVGVSSTGVIGLELPRDKVVSGARAACGALGKDAKSSRRRFSRAMRADARLPRGRAAVGQSVRLAAQAKGAG